MRLADLDTGVAEVLHDLGDVDDHDDVRAEMIMRETLADLQALPAGTVLHVPHPLTREQAIVLLERSIERGITAGAMRAGARKVFAELAGGGA